MLCKSDKPSIIIIIIIGWIKNIVGYIYIYDMYVSIKLLTSCMLVYIPISYSRDTIYSAITLPQVGNPLQLVAT